MPLQKKSNRVDSFWGLF